MFSDRRCAISRRRRQLHDISSVFVGVDWQPQRDVTSVIRWNSCAVPVRAFDHWFLRSARSESVYNTRSRSVPGMWPGKSIQSSSLLAGRRAGSTALERQRICWYSCQWSWLVHVSAPSPPCSTVRQRARPAHAVVGLPSWVVCPLPSVRCRWHRSDHCRPQDGLGRCRPVVINVDGVSLHV